jgi:hypothetical protein
MFKCDECAAMVPNIVIISDVYKICVKCIPTYTQRVRDKRDMLLNIWKNDQSFCHVCEFDLDAPPQLWMYADYVNADIAICNDHRCKTAIVTKGCMYSHKYECCSRCDRSIKKYVMTHLNRERLCILCAGQSPLIVLYNPNQCAICGLIGKPRRDLNCGISAYTAEIEWRCSSC